MIPAEGDAGGTAGRAGRKSRANAGARLRDILQEEAKDLKVEEEDEEEAEEAPQKAPASKKARQTRQQQQHAAAHANGVADVKQEQPSDSGSAPEDAMAVDAAAAGAEAAAEPSAAAAVSKARKKAAAVAAAPMDVSSPVAAAVADPAAAAAAAAAGGGTAAVARAVKAPLQRLPRPVKGPDEGAGAAAGQALGAADACWSAPPPAASSKQQQPRGAKRKRSGKASTPPPDATTETGTEDGEDAAAGPRGNAPAQQQPQGKPLPVGSRPSWLVQARAGGSAALNKRQAKGLPDDLSQPQQVEFMLGCADCDYQQHGCPQCRQQPEVARPMARWQPDKGHPQVDLAEAATFTPTWEEFADPFTYIASIAERFVKQGMAKVVPPAGCWAPPQYVQQVKAAASSGGSGGPVDELPVSAQRQFISHMCGQAMPAAPSSGAGASTSRPSQSAGLEQVLGADAELLQGLDKLARAGPAAAAAAAEGQSALQSNGGADAAAAAAAVSSGQQDAAAAAAAIKQEQPDQHPEQQPEQPEGCSMWRQHTLRSFAAYADWAKRMHFSCQPCNAELQAVLGPAGVQQGGAQVRRTSSMGMPPAKRPKYDPADAQPQPSRDTGATEAEGTEDAGDADGAAESSKDRTAPQHPPERHSSRLQAKGRAPLHPLKGSLSSSAGRGASPEAPAGAAAAAAAVKAKVSKAAASTTTSATPPTTPRTKAVKSGSRLVGAAAGMLGLAAVHPDTAASIDAVEAEFWRLVEQQQPGRLAEVLTVPELRSSLVQELAEQQQQQQQHWGSDEQQQQQVQQQQACGAGSNAWDLSSWPAKRENLLRYLPLQQAIPGLTEPVLGVSSCLSTGCWQVTRQGMYAISCLHSGAPRVWYAVPESAHEAFLVAMQDCLPHLFAANPSLLQQAATAVSPNELRARGVPVCRLVQEPGTFVVLLPNAHHCWVSTGLAIHESVAVAPWDSLGTGCDAERSCRQQAIPTAVSQTELLVTLVSSCRCVADARGVGGGDIDAEIDEHAAAVASAALAALSRARVRPVSRAAKQPDRMQQQQDSDGSQQDTDADEPDQRPASKHKQGAQQQKRQERKQRRQSPGAARRKASESMSESDTSSSYTDAGSGSDTDAGSVQALTVSYASSTQGDDDDTSSSGGSSDGSDSEAEASQPCWGAAAGAQQLLEPGLAWSGGACASAALELVPKPAILAAVGELVLRVEEEQCRQAAARQFGVKQEQRMHGAVLPVNHCTQCSTDLWLSAVTSSAAPGQAVCPEHAAALSAAPDSCTLLFRHSIEELQRLLFEAAALFPGCADDVRAAQQRVRTRPSIRGLKSLGPVVELPHKLPAPRAPELRPGGREPQTPVADWVKQLMGLAAARLPLVGNGHASRLPHKQRRAAVKEGLQAAATAFAAVQSGSSADSADMGQKLPVRPLRHTDPAVQHVVQQLLKHGAARQATSSKAAGKAAGKAGGRGKQQQQRSDSSGSDEDSSASDGSGSEDEGEEKQEAPLQPRQRKLPGWLQSECVVDRAVAKRAKSSAAGAAAGKAAGGSARDAAAAAAAIAASFRLPEVVRFAEQAMELVAANKALARQERQKRRQQRQQLRQQQLQKQLQEQRRQHQEQHEHQEQQFAANGVALPAGALTAQQLTVLQQQQQLLALQQQSQQLLLAAAPVSQHRPPQARPSREQLREGGSSGGRSSVKGRPAGKGSSSGGGRAEGRMSSSGGGKKGAAAAAGTDQQQQLAAQLTMQQLQLQAQFRAAALAAAAAAAGQGTPAAAAVPGGAGGSAAATAAAAAAAGAQLAQATAAGVPGLMGFPGPLITMHNGVPVLIFAAPLPQQQQQQQQSGSVSAAVPADPAAAAAAATVAPAEAGDGAQAQALQQAQQAQQGQQQQQQPDPVSRAAEAAAPAAATAAPPAAAPAAPDSSEALPFPELTAAQAAALAGSGSGATAPGAAADAAAASGAAAGAPAAAAAAAAGGSRPGSAAGSQQGGDTLPAHSSGQLASSASMQHNSGQLTDAVAAAAAAQAEAEAVASQAAAAAVAAAAAEARLAAGIVGNGNHHQPPAMSMPPAAVPAAAAATLPASAPAVGSTAAAPLPVMQQQLSLPHALPAVTAAAAAGQLPLPPATMPLPLQQPPAAGTAWQQQAAAAQLHPVDCMLQVEEFFHSQEPGHIEAPVAPAAAPEPAPEPEAAPPAVAAVAPAAAPEVPAAAAAEPAAPAAEGPAAAAAGGSGGCAGPEPHAAPECAVSVEPAAPAAAASGEGQAEPAASEAPTAPAPAAAAAPAPGAAAGGLAPPAPAAAAAPVRRAAGGDGSGGGGGGSDDQMDELELEPLVDFGMDDFDW